MHGPIWLLPKRAAMMGLPGGFTFRQGSADHPKIPDTNLQAV
jgi:hypothetical protein